MKRHLSSDLKSDDTDDDTPILQLSYAAKKKKFSNNGTNDLYKFCQEKCEFCEKLLFCSYDMLVHNAKHIIIPLNNKLVQCSQCNLYFGTTVDLEIHTKTDHFEVPDILERIVFSKPIVKCDNSLTELVIQNNERKLDKILHKQAVVECDSTVTELIREKNIEKLKDFVTKQPVIRCIDTIKNIFSESNNMECDDDKLKIDLINSVPQVVLKKPDLLQSNINNMTQQEEDIELNACGNVKSRLIFEDDSDFEEDIILTSMDGVTNNPKIDCQDICDLTLVDSDDEITTPNSASQSFVKTTVNRTELSEEKMPPAVHYDDLIVPCILECNRCDLTFNNRYDLVIHETKIHLKFKKAHDSRAFILCTVCDKYITGNHWTLKHHMLNKHPSVIYNRQAHATLKKCPICKLKYHLYSQHCLNYHSILNCPICSKAFEKESQLTEHVQICKGKVNSIPQVIEKIIKVCELCSLFFKNTQALKYVPISDYSEKGKRITCQRCEKKFFEVKLIKLINNKQIVQPFYEYQKKSMPVTTNEERLKKIRKRFKMMKKLNKFI